jgi:hypothetical protein
MFLPLRDHSTERDRKTFPASFMNNFFRALIAGYGAKKLGGGCFGTIIVFLIIWWALGQCDGGGYGY